MYNFVTSFHKKHEEVYGLKMLDSVVSKWKPTDFKLHVYLEGYDGKSDGLPQADFIEYRHLENIQARADFITRNSDKNGRFGEAPYNYRMDAVRFCHKVYAMSDLFFELLDAGSEDWMVWLDADTITKKMFKAEDAAKILIPEVDIVHLGRIDIDYSETGFVGFNLSMHNACSLLVDLRGAYDTDEVLAYREWTDAFVFTRLLKIYEAHGAKARNLSEGVRGLAVFDQCMLNEYFTHNKGNLKFLNPADRELSKDMPADAKQGPQRYKKLAALVRNYSEGLDTFSIVETGTWNGGRAIEMALTAFESVDEVHYRGFDLFEQATEETDAVELNVKGHNALTAVTERLEHFKERSAAAGKKFSFKLYAGDTKKTMKGLCYDDVDFVFIDGGHSLDTVSSDYSFVKDCPVVVFDDYYSTQEDKELPEEHTGIIQTFIAIEDRKKHILPSEDPTAFGGIVHLAVCVKKEYKDVPAELLRVPIIVKPKDSMPSKHIKKSVTENIAKIDDWDWVKQYKTTDDHVMIVSGGTIDFDKVRETQKKYNAKIWCVKHSYPRLLKEGITPDACMILDPRSIDGISTHGVKRKDLFKDMNKDTTFYIASMTDEGVVDYILERTDNVKGFHAFTDSLRDETITDKFVIDPKLGITPGSSLVSGGTASATRTLGLLELLGYRNIHLFGFDCSVPEDAVKKDDKDEMGNPRYLNVEIGGEKFWTTGELLALAQDLEKLFERRDYTLNLSFYGEGTLAAAVWKGGYYNNNVVTFEEYINA